MARGVLVSRGSPGIAVFSSISQRSNLVRSSPMERANSVMAGGPPIARNSRLAAALSLCCTAAAHSCASGMALPACGAVTGELGSNTEESMKTACCKSNSPRWAFCRTRAAA